MPKQRLENLIGQEVSILSRKTKVKFVGLYLDDQLVLNVAYQEGVFVKTTHFSNCQEVYDMYLEDSGRFISSIGIEY